MHLKKWLCMLVALVAANAVFAGSMLPKNLANPALPAKTIKVLSAPTTVNGKYPERSQLEYIINGSFLPYELLPLLQPVGEDLEPVVDTATALRAGLLAYEADVRSGRQLTGNNKSIDGLLRQIPVIFNKIQNSTDEITDEILPVLEELTVNIVDNQRKVNAGDVNQELASQLLMTFAYQKAELEGDLTGRVSRIFQQEIQAIMQSM